MLAAMAAQEADVYWNGEGCMTVAKVKGGYEVKSEKTGKAISKVYPSKGAAEKRLGQIEYFKHNPGI